MTPKTTHHGPITHATPAKPATPAPTRPAARAQAPKPTPTMPQRQGIVPTTTGALAPTFPTRIVHSPAAAEALKGTLAPSGPETGQQQAARLAARHRIATHHTGR
jgi:hypothetical protein